MRLDSSFSGIKVINNIWNKKETDRSRDSAKMDEKGRHMDPDYKQFEFEFNKTARNKYENPYLETAKRMTGERKPIQRKSKKDKLESSLFFLRGGLIYIE